MSHELRTPLNSLLILARLLSENKDGNLTVKQVEFSQTILGAGTDLLNLINDVLDLSKVEAGKMEVNPTEVPTGEVRAFVERNFRPMADQKALQFEVVVQPDLPPTIFTDGQRLQQILKNLIANAIKFTERGGVTLTMRRAEKNERGRRFTNATLDHADQVVAFQVTDTGIGIPKEKQRLIFEAFQQADGTTSRKFGGTGLGLSISREIARLLGGEIRVESTPGQGSTFTLFLPARFVDANGEGGSGRPSRAGVQVGFGGYAVTAPARPSGPTRRPEAGAPPAPEPTSGGRAASPAPAATSSFGGALGAMLGESGGTAVDDDLDADSGVVPPTLEPGPVPDDRFDVQAGDRTVLIVENDVTFAKVLLDMARERGFKGIVAVDGRSGIELAHQLQPDAITLDIDLAEGVDGFQVLERLKRHPETRHIPVHIISGIEKRHQGLQAGAMAYLEKPVSKDALDDAFARIESFVDSSVKRLLVVEDDAAQRRSIVELIAHEDVEITAVSSAQEAIDELARQRFDCMVLDLGLGGENGFELLERLKNDPDPRTRELPIIIYTGRQLSPQEETQLRRYAETIIVKDVKSPERLLDETALFLHRVEARLPEQKRRMLEHLHNADAVFAGKRVLIVDDDVRNIFSLTSLLEDHGMQVSFAENGRDAIAALEQRTGAVDLVLMDIMMPEMDGYETTRRIRQDARFKALPIIALTAKAMKGDREKTIAAGASDYITKPVDPEQLLSLMRVWLYR
jgi:CheY-like chemotaxis protein